MKIAILTAGRFHVLDLAIELARLGHEVRFHSLVPPWQTRRFGLPARCNRWLGPLLGPLYLACRGLSGTRAEAPAQRALVLAIDRVGAQLIGRCDAFIGMSGMSLHTIKRLKRSGATTFVERGSMHIEAQKQILDAHRGPLRVGSDVPGWMVAREKAEYAAADYISLPSRHAEESFLERGFDPSRLLRNPYGVSLDQFPATTAPPPRPRRLLMVGTWSWQKGVDVLVESFVSLRQEYPDLELHHVGALGDVPFPSDLPGAFHHDAVPQPELTRHYAQAHVFVLASRQDGFGVVLSQALASGLPLVCTTRTGGFDLAKLLGGSPAITLTTPGDPTSLRDGIATQLARLAPIDGPRDLLGEVGRWRLSWRAYGERWHANLVARVAPHRP